MYSCSTKHFYSLHFAIFTPLCNTDNCSVRPTIESIKGYIPNIRDQPCIPNQIPLSEHCFSLSVQMAWYLHTLWELEYSNEAYLYYRTVTDAHCDWKAFQCSM